MTRYFIVCLIALTALAAPISGAARATEAVILVDAEFGNPTSTSAQAIALGARMAARDINQSGMLGEIRLSIRTSDNRGVSAIAVDNFLEAARDPSIVAVMGGKFSPVQIEVVPHTRAQGLMLLNPWGSADGIIDNGLRPNWAYRLSLKDEWASEAFLREAKRRGAKQVGVILPNTAWGRSSFTALSSRAARDGIRIVGDRWYNWGDKSLVQRYRDLLAEGAEAIILVANEVEGSILVKEVADLPETLRRPILSHWGVTGGNFERLAGEALPNVDFVVIQTFSFHLPRTKKADAFREAVLKEMNVSSAFQVESQVGIAHAYDLTWALAYALRQAGSVDRAKVRDEMERLPAFEGVVRHYERPFTETRHEALSLDEVFFARYRKEGGLVPVD